MASKSIFTTKDFDFGLPSSYRFSAKFSTRGMLKFEVTSKSNIDLAQRLQNATNRASQRIVADLKDALSSALRSGVWPTLGGTADIYDTGELLASGSVTFSDDSITVAYDAPYAALVHYGGYINPYGNTASKVYLPPRPWVDSVLRGGGPVSQFDFQSYYLQELRSEFGA
jgi:phage gpG-like protein